VSERGRRVQRMKMKGVKGGASCMEMRKNQEGVDEMRKRKSGQVVDRMKMSLVGPNAGRMMGSMKARIEEIEDGGEGRKRKPLAKLRGLSQVIGSLDAIVVVQGAAEMKMIEARNANRTMTPPSNTGPVDPEDEMRSAKSHGRDDIDATTRILLIPHHAVHVGKRRTANRAKPPGGVGERKMTLSRDRTDLLKRMETGTTSRKRAGHCIDVVLPHQLGRGRKGNAMTKAHETVAPMIVTATRDVHADHPQGKWTSPAAPLEHHHHLAAKPLLLAPPSHHPPAHHLRRPMQLLRLPTLLPHHLLQYLVRWINTLTRITIPASIWVKYPVMDMFQR